MVKQGLAFEDEKALIEEMKAQRGDFAGVELEKITQYCLSECRLLASRMTQLRELFYKADIRPVSWHGPGALASAVFRDRWTTKDRRSNRREVSPRPTKLVIATSTPSLSNSRPFCKALCTDPCLASGSDDSS